MNDNKILAAIEQFGASFPWDTVSIWLQREPDGKISFVYYVASAPERGIGSAIGSGPTLEEAFRACRADGGVRDPEVARERRIRELKEQLQKLEAANFGPPPYRPGSQLAAGALNLSIDIETQTDRQPPF